MKKTHKFEINALNVIKSIPFTITIIIIIIVLSIINESNSSHSKDNNNKIASVSTFGALEQMLFGDNNSNSNNNTYSNINYNTGKQETETKIKIERCQSKQHGYTNSNKNNNNNNNSFTNYTPVTKINEIIKNVQSADCPTTVSSTATMTTTTATTTTILPTPTSSSMRISQSNSNEQTAASWSSVARKRIDNSNSYDDGIINIRNSNGKKSKTDIWVGSEVFGDLHQMRLFNEKDLAHGIQQQLNLNLPPPVWGRMTATINKRQRTKRFVIFDGSGVVKLIIGGSIPIKLISKQRSLSHVFNLQMQYTPPPIPLYWWSFYNTTTFAARSVAQQVPLLLPNDASRSFVYAIIEKILESSKEIPGTECLLKAICIIGQQPLESGNVFHEILNAIFTPEAANIETKYLDAQAAGRFGVECTQTFPKCPINMGWLSGITLATL